MTTQSVRTYQCCNACKHQADNYYGCGIPGKCFNGFNAYEPKSNHLFITVYGGENTAYGEMYAVDYNSSSIGMTLFTGDRTQAQAEYDRLQALTDEELRIELMNR